MGDHIPDGATVRHCFDGRVGFIVYPADHPGRNGADAVVRWSTGPERDQEIDEALLEVVAGPPGPLVMSGDPSPVRADWDMMEYERRLADRRGERLHRTLNVSDREAQAAARIAAIVALENNDRLSDADLDEIQREIEEDGYAGNSSIQRLLNEVRTLNSEIAIASQLPAVRNAFALLRAQ